MKEIVLYEPPSCCGADPSQEMIEVASQLNLLGKMGVIVKRYGLSQNLGAFARQEDVRRLLFEKGTDVLPIIIVDGVIRFTGRYPTKQEFAAWIKEIEKEGTPGD